MKINLSHHDINRLQTLIDVKDTNIQVAEMYLYYLMEEPFYITDKLKRTSDESSDDTEAFYVLLMQCLAVDLIDEQNQLLAKRYFHDGIKKLDPSIFRSNPFYQLIHPKEEKLASWSIEYLNYQPYQGFACDDIIVDQEDFHEISPVGFFDEAYSYLAIFEKGKLWMSLIPHEIITMQGPLKQMHGDIIVFGLGLGYFTFMAALKDEVKHITVIEKDKNVIALFKSTIYPLFPNQEKVTIIAADGFDYLKTMPQHFNTAFVDIWLGVNDGIWPYLMFKVNEENVPFTHFTYWIEKSLLAYLRRLVLIYLQEVLEEYSEDKYLIAKTDEDKIINALHRYLHDVSWKTYEQIHDFLSDQSLLKVAKSLDL